MSGTEGTRREQIRSKVEEKLRPVTLPNFLTLLRMAMIPFFLIAVARREYEFALWTFGLAGATDLVDGWLARRLNMQSLIGAYLDPLADKLLLITAYVALAIPQGQAVVIPLWLAILVLFRDFLILVMAVVLYLVEDIRSFPPSFIGKVTTCAHVLTVGVVLLADTVEIPAVLPQACFYLSFVLVILSGFGYIYRTSRFIEAARLDRVEGGGARSRAGD